MWDSVKSWFSSNPKNKHDKTRKLAKEVARYMKRGTPRSDSASESASASESYSARRSSRKRRHRHDKSRHKRHRKDDARIRELKDELGRLDRKYESSSESSSETGDFKSLQKDVDRLGAKFNKARQELTARMVGKAAKDAAKVGASPAQYEAAIKAAMAAANSSAPGLASVMPFNPAGITFAAQSALTQATYANPLATQAELDAANAKLALDKMRAQQEAAERAGRHFEVNAANAAQVSANLNAANTNVGNIAAGLVGAVAAPINLAAAAVNQGKSNVTKIGQWLGYA